MVSVVPRKLTSIESAVDANVSGALYGIVFGDLIRACLRAARYFVACLAGKGGEFTTFFLLIVLWPTAPLAYGLAQALVQPYLGPQRGSSAQSGPLVSSAALVSSPALDTLGQT